MAKKVGGRKSNKGYRPQKPCPTCGEMMEIVVVYPKKQTKWKCDKCNVYFAKKRNDHKGA